MVTIRPELSEDAADIRRVNEEAFERAVEADLIEKLRARDKVTLSLVATSEEGVVGHILFSPVTIESAGQNHAALALGTMSVLPSHQNSGIGSQLVRAGLEECRRLGHEIVVVLGHAEYYPRFGFDKASAHGIGCEYDAPDEAFMVLELRDGALAGKGGTVKYQPEFGDT
ncbi:GNAT family N-acetyltransferase [Chloroflexota bacterium]